MQDEVLKLLNKPITSKDIAEKLNINIKIVSPILSYLKKIGRVKVYDYMLNERSIKVARYTLNENYKKFKSIKLPARTDYNITDIILKHKDSIIYEQRQQIVKLYLDTFKIKKIMSKILELPNKKTETNWTSYLAIGIAEGFETLEYNSNSNLNKNEFYSAIKIEAWAIIIKYKLYTSLQGWFGRQSKILMEEGIIENDGFINWENIE